MKEIKSRITNITLSNVEYNFIPLEDDTKPINIETIDKININEINKSSVSLNVERMLKFTPFDNTYVKVVYTSQIELNEELSKDSIIDCIRKEKIQLNEVLASISLMVSQLTNMSPFGVLISAPMLYNIETMIIE